MKKRPSVKSQIERASDVTKRELVWGKSIGKGLKQVKAKSTKRAIEFRTFEEFIKAFPKSHFFIHQHLPKGKATAGRALIPTSDILRLSNLMEAGKAKTGVVATLNKDGKVVGYTFYKIDRPVPKGAILIIEMELAHDLKEGRFSARNPAAFNKLITEYLGRFDVKLKQRFVAMPGHRFNEKTGRFLKIRKRGKK
jgi:hypothetical protein